MPVGSTKTLQLNARIITATNRVLEQEIIAGNFREDLYYRLAVVPMRVPSLRERHGDIPLLVNHFLRKYSQRLGKDVQTISSYGMEVLMQYDFPGNVRELENIIERGVAMESSNIILPDNLILSSHRRQKEQTVAVQPQRQETLQPAPAAAIFVAAQNEEELFTRGLDNVLEELERKIILHALAKADNSKTKAAELLQLSFRSLRYKTKKLGID